MNHQQVADGLTVARRGGLDVLFRPRGTLVVGASTDPSKLGGAMAASLARARVPLALVNARGADGLHATVGEAVASTPSPIDLAVLCVPATACPDVLREVGDAGVGAAVVCAGGFAEGGPEGMVLQERLIQAAQSRGVRLLGPNTSGFFVPHRNLLASFVPGVAGLAAGGVGVVAASGGLNHALAFALDRAGVGVSIGVGIGAGVDVAAPEVIEHLADDEATTVIALHVETVSDGPGLLAAVAQASARKPVVAMVVGRNDVSAFAQSHTGALATSWRATRALLRQAGAVVVDDVDALVAAAGALSRVRLPASPSPAAALVTPQAGPGLVVADAVQTAGVMLPHLSASTMARLGELLPPMTYQANPVDTGRPGPRHGDVVHAVASDPGIAVTAVYALAEPVVDIVDAVQSARRAGCAVVVGVDGPAPDVAACLRQGAHSGTAVVTGPDALATAVAALVEDARLRSAAGGQQRPADGAVTLTCPTSGWTEAAAKDALDTAGLVTPRRRVCRDAEAVVTAWEDYGPRVVVKLSDAQVLHKSDVGGVILGVDSPEAAREAFIGLVARTGAVEVLVEEMAQPGVDLLVSARRDPVFGPVVVLGVGGTATEVYADLAIAQASSTLQFLRALPDALTARPFLDGHRGTAPVDRDELARVLACLGDLLVANPEIEEIEINPLRATSRGLIALDAVIVSTVGSTVGSTSGAGVDP